MPLLETAIQPRIVSLIASATEIVHALGLGAYQVGRSHECDYPADVERLRCCTRPRFDCSGDSSQIDTLVKETLSTALSVYEVFDDALEDLQPTHILTQTQCEVCAVSLKDVERSVACRLGSQPQVVALQSESLVGIWEDIRRVARGVGCDGETTIGALQKRMGKIRDVAHGDSRRPRVACIEWLEPLMAAGNWVPELVELANGENIFGEAGKHSPWMTWEQLVDADPDVIIAMPCGFNIERTSSEMHWITSKPGYGKLRAVKTGQVYVADGNQYFNRPGPRVVESLQISAEILHPVQAGTSFIGTGYVRCT